MEALHQYPLTPLQHGMLFQDLLEPGVGSLVIQEVCTLPHRVEAGALRRAWEEVTARYDVLRTSLHWENLESPVQEVHSAVALPWAEHDWRDAGSAIQDQRLRTFLEADRRRGFDLRAAPLHRLTLLQLADDAYRLVWTIHHSILDGRSVTTVLGEVFARVDGARSNLNAESTPPPSFQVFADWLREKSPEAAEGFWRERLSGLRLPTPIPVPRPAAALDESVSRSGYRDGGISARATARLHRWALDHHFNLHTIVQGLWAAMLWQHSAERDVVFGVTRAGRYGVPRGNELVGLLINTLPLRLSIEPDRPVADWLVDVRRAWMELRGVEQTPLGLVQRWSGLPPGTALFESLVLFEHDRTENILLATGKTWETRSVRGLMLPTYPLTLAVWGGEALAMRLRYDRARVDDASASRVLAHVTLLLERLTERPDQRLRDLPRPAEGTSHGLGEEPERWNDTTVDEGAPATLVDLFEQQAARVPDRPAVVAASRSVLPAGAASDAGSLTYRELQARANRLARELLGRGLAHGACVGLLLDRSVDAVVGLVGILQAGGAYMPLSVDAPAARIAQQLGESGASHVVTVAGLAPLVAGLESGLTILLLDGGSAWSGDDSPAASTRLPHPSPDDIAYVLYTGGSTGVPKGVAVTHANAVHYARAVSRVLGDVPPATPGDGLAALDGLQLGMISTLCADSGNTSLHTGLLAGATVHVLAHDVATEPRRFAEYVTVRPLDMLKVMSNHLNALSGGRTGTALGAILPRRWLVLGGESLSLAFARTVLDGARCRVLNHYGPTETTVGVLTFEVTPDSLASAVALGAATVPIGRPLANTRARIVDEHGQEQAVGIPGELLLSGAGVAAGYLNRPELTVERFVEFGGERTYRSGDRARRLADGTVEFLGRFDDQVKVRGNRVELGEIEHMIRRHPAIAQAVVLARPGASGDTEVVAFVVALSPEPTASQLTSWIAARLPGYMVPASVLVLDALPLTAGGKVDRSRLLESTACAAASEPSYRAPRTGTESRLASIWADVLKRNLVGATDTFQALGGHSLVAIRILGRISQAFGVRLPLRALFDAPTIAQLAELVDAAVAGAGPRGIVAIPIPRTDPAGPAPLSIGQELLWLVEQATNGQAAYNVPHALRVRGWFDQVSFRRALDGLVERHDVLRSHFPAVDGLPVQILASEGRPEVEVLDFRRRPEATRLDEARAWLLAAARRPFDLAGELPIRSAIAQVADGEQWVLLSLHHLVSDGWTRNVLFHEVSELYEAAANRRPSGLLPLPLQYRDFARWQREQLQGERLERLLEFWRGQLPDSGEPIALPYDHARSPAPAPAFAGGRATRALSGASLNAVKALGASCGASLFVTLLSAFQTLLHRYGGQRSVAIATPVAGRERAELEALIGFFSNTLFLRATYDQDPTFRTVLARGQERAHAAFEHQDLPYERMVAGTARSFQAMFSMEHEDRVPLRLGAAEVTPLDIGGIGVAKADIGLVAIETGDSLRVTADYRVDRFERSTIERMLGHLDTLLADAIARPDTPVSRLALLSADERATLAGWSGSPDPGAGEEATLHGMVADQVGRTPDLAAVTDGASSISYAELARRAAAVATHLRHAGVRPGDRIGVLVDRSIDLVPGLLGILQAGAAYVPIDSGYPRGRVARILEDSRVAAILADDAGAGRLAESDGMRILLREAVAGPVVPVDPARDSRAPAYVIYTSGSTGVPKGVVIGHHALVNHMRWMQGQFPLGPGDVVLQRTSIAFDASVWEFWAPLVSGACIRLADPMGDRDPAYLAELLGSGEVTTAQFVPTLLQAVLEMPGFVPSPRLTRVFCGGEPLSPALVSRFRAVSDAVLVNLYGPTEATIDATSWTANASEPVPPIIPIGRPIANVRAYVLDANGELLPCGVVGELFIGGEGLADGYWGRPDLTAERFLPDPFRPGGRMYRTGDRVRWMADGNLQYVGRMDDQIKLRGFRVELGEIEATIASLDGVRGAAVVVRVDAMGLQRLLGYFVADTSSAISPAEVRAALRDRLPTFMVPTAVTRLAELPLTSSGKVDRAALPEPEESTSGPLVAPRSATESGIAEAWCEVLGRAEVGVTENFFDIGGHSLLGLRVLARIAERWGVRLPMRAIFDFPTIAGLSARVDEARAAGPATAPIPRLERPTGAL